MTVASLVDTNILVYCYDPGDPEKREAARRLLRKGAAKDELRSPHPAMVEFVNAVTRGRAGGRSLLTREEAWRQAEDLLNEFPVLYPNESVFRTALLGMAAYRFSWYMPIFGPMPSTLASPKFSLKTSNTGAGTAPCGCEIRLWNWHWLRPRRS